MKKKDKVGQDEYLAAIERLRERYPNLHFAQNGAMHIGALPCVVCDQETVDNYRRQER